MAVPSRFEVSGRWTKAWRLAGWIQRNGIGLELVETWDEDQWNLAGRQAGCKKPPSAQTRGIVLGLLAGGDER